MAQLRILTGSMGSGKSAVLAEASDILSLHRIVHAVIDLDSLGFAHLSSGASCDAVMYENLRSVSRNYAALGVHRFLLARAMEDRAELDLCRQAVSATHTVVCRLTASLETMQQRVKRRELGIARAQFVARVAELEAILDRARLEDFSVANENRSLSDVALEVLVKVGWNDQDPR